MKNYFIIIILLALASTSCRTGKLPITPHNADLLYEKHHYLEASNQYNKLYRKEKEPSKQKKYLSRLANCYVQMSDYPKALNYYEEAYAKYPNQADIQVAYAKMLMANEQYSRAKMLYEEYQKLAPGDKRIAAQIEMCELALRLTAEGSPYKIERLLELNSKYNDYAPVILENGIYFTSDRTEATGDEVFPWLGTQYSDIFFAKKNDKGGFDNANPLSNEINTNLNEGVSSFNGDGTMMVFTQCNGPSFDSSCAILSASRSRGQWKKPEKINFDFDPKFLFGQASISPDGKQMLLVSNLSSGYGGHDIYIAKLNSKTGYWGNPENLGSRINTDGDEMFPFFYDDNTIYFSSNGHPGFGGLDIFKAVKINGKWRKPSNLLVPMNSGGDDFGITFDRSNPMLTSGYFSSNRKGTEGDDIFEFEMVQPPLCTVTGTVYDKKTKKPLANSVVYLDEIGSNNPVYIQTDEDGKYSMKLLYDKEYKMDAYKKYYAFNDDKPRINTRDQAFQKEFQQDFYLDKWVIEEIKIEGVYYDVNSSEIRDDAKPVLDSLARILKIHYYLGIELASHTDCRADSIYNMKLSQARAEACVAYLSKAGIDKARLTAKGYGENKLLNDCACEGDVESNCSDKEHQLNRRTTFRILRTDYQTIGDKLYGEPYKDPE